MRVSTKGRYGLRVMIELALRNGQGPVVMGKIAKSQGISRKYMHSLLTSLKSAGLVHSVRGASGGYVLAELPEKITAGEVVKALEGPFALVDCVTDSSVCDRVDSCVTREVWKQVGEAAEKVLSDITIGQLAERQRAVHPQDAMYYI
ncbi:MAG TPA: Rrf2 family transcriptional regulator [Myxococcota bacterium]|nr:Rrf2 family transcriptional regulator [Myxococcota bacterium]